MDFLTTALIGVINAIETGMGTYANMSPLASMGTDLLGGIVAMLVVWTGFKGYLEGAGARQMIASLLSLFIMTGIATMLIQDTFGVKNAIVQTINSVAQQLEIGTSGRAGVTTNNMGVTQNANAPGNAVASGSAPGYDLMLQGFAMCASAIDNIWNERPPVNSGTATPAPGSTTPATTNPVSTNTSIVSQITGGFSAFLNTVTPSNLLKILGTMILKLVAIALLAFSGILVTFYFIYSQVLISISYIIAPLFIPFMVWEPAAFIFNGWVSFFLKALMYKLVGLVMIVLLSSVVQQGIATLNAQQASQTNAAGYDFFVMLGVCITAFIYAYMMQHIPEIVGGLISGGPSGKSVANIASKAGGQMFSNATGGGGGAASAGSAAATAATGGTAAVASAAAAGGSASPTTTQVSFSQAQSSATSAGEHFKT